MKKSERLGIRLSPEEKKAWERAAAANNMSVSAWVSAWANLGSKLAQPPKS